MLDAITDSLSDFFSEKYSIKEQKKLSGGSIHHALWVSNGTIPVFVKYNSREHLAIFMFEAEQLALLARSKTVLTPKVYATGHSREHSFILLEYLPCKTLDLHHAYLLGQQLARLHKWIEQPQFGLDFDNDLNTTPQPNGWQRRWSTFYAEQRIGWQLTLAAEHNIVFGDIDKIVECIKRKLSNHQPHPSLLHGDLWPSNCGLCEQGNIIFDPACYWGDRECDLAMLPLFTHLPTQIYDGYQSIWPLSSDFITRQPIYQLYYLLNQCNLYGERYISPTQTLLECIMYTE